MKKHFQLTFLAFIANLGVLFAQTDSLSLSNNLYLVGEIKSMDKAVVVIETDYSKDDFRIEWSGILGIFTSRSLLITTSDGEVYYGSVTSPEPGQVVIKTEDEGEVNIPIGEIVYIKPIDRGFADRISGGLDFGYTMTRARNQRQLTMRSRLGYVAELWYADLVFNALRTTQDDVDNFSCTDGNFSFVRILGKDWFAVARIDYLQNTEQRLDLRMNYKLGVGNFLVRSNKMAWSVQGGASFNNENFWGTVDDRRSAESWIGTQLNLFEMGDLSLLTNAFVYPSLTESGRIRFDYLLDLKYDLPLDFYIKTGLTLNYDNQPASEAATTDYVWQTTVGWSW